MKVKIEGSSEEVECAFYKAVEKGSLKGFFSVMIYPIGIRIIDCRHFEAKGGTWFKFPQKQITKKDGEIDYMGLVHIVNKEYEKKFNEAILQSLKEAINEAQQSQQNSPTATSAYQKCGLPSREQLSEEVLF